MKKKELLMIDMMGMTAILLMGMIYGWIIKDLHSEYQDSKNNNTTEEILFRKGDIVETMKLRNNISQG